MTQVAIAFKLTPTLPARVLIRTNTIPIHIPDDERYLSTRNRPDDERYRCKRTGQMTKGKQLIIVIKTRHQIGLKLVYKNINVYMFHICLYLF